MAVANPHRFLSFITQMDALVFRASNEEALLQEGRLLLANLVAADDWLPAPYASAARDGYQQYLLYRDRGARFSVVSFVWGPGQATPVHNHTVWGLVGVLRGAELSQAFTLDNGRLSAAGPPSRLGPGQVEAVSPAIGDIHRVANASDDQVSVSIHVYGADIGRVERRTFDEGGRAKAFVSGYVGLAPLLSTLEATH